MSKEDPAQEQSGSKISMDWSKSQSPELAAAWLTAIIESADDAIITKTLEGVITSWNRGAERMFGYTADEVVDKPVTILIPQDHIDEEPDIIARLRAGERIEHYETVRVRKDGTLIEISLTVSPIAGANNKIIGASKIADTRELLKTSLCQCGAQVTVAGSTGEAFEAIRNSVPDVLISDIGMPDEDGYDLIRRLRALPFESGGKVPAIALTAYARVEDRLQALRAGYQMHVPKPVELAELVAVVASLAERNI